MPADDVDVRLSRRRRANAELEAFGYDPWQMERFLLRSPEERLKWAGTMAKLITRGRQSLARTRTTGP